MRIKIICVAYERPVPLEILIRSFILQTDPNWILNIAYDGKAPQSILDVVYPFVSGERKDDRIHFYESPERYQNYGHPNRRTMLQAMDIEPGDYILMTNDDNYYVPRFVEFMLKECIGSNKAGIIYCDTVHSHMEYNVHKSSLVECGIDMGCFIVKGDVAKETGFNHNHFSADGTYAVECLKTATKRGYKVVKINKPLFIHN